MPTSEYRQLFEIDAGEKVFDVTFTANGEHLVSGSGKAVQVWQVKDGKHVATMAVENGVFCVAASRDGKWIAAGSWNSGFVSIWDATTYKRVSLDQVGSDIRDLDFSADSTRLVCADSYHLGKTHTATIWDIKARKQVQTLEHSNVKTAKYSPKGDRIATAGGQFVRVWDSNDGRLLSNLEVGVNGRFGLCWRNSHLFVTTNDGKIKQINTSTGSTVKEWPVSHANSSPCIVQPHNRKFLAHSAGKTISFLDTSSIIRPDPIQYSDDIRSIVCSSDGKRLAIAAGRKIIVKNTSSVASRFASVTVESGIAAQGPLSANVIHLISEPPLDIDNAALTAWKHGQFADADALLSSAISASENVHPVFASRALVRVRLGDWNAAIVDANKSIEIERSPLAYAAKFAALVGIGKKDEGIRVCDIAFEHFHSEYVPTLLLIKAIVLFIAGDHVDAISRMHDLITDNARTLVDPAFYGVQAYMLLLHGDKHMENNDYERAIQSFEDARMKLGNFTRQPPLIVSLISGWCFDDLVIRVQKRLCEALLVANRMKEAAECVVRMPDEEIIKTWVSDFKSRCRAKSECLGDSAMNAERYEEAISQYTVALSLGSAGQQGLLVKRSRMHAEQENWNDALNDANKVIELDPSSPLGYERKHAALLGLRHHNNAVDAFDIMLLKMSESSDPNIRDQSRRFVPPEQTKKAIRASIENAICNSPTVLIDTSSGRLCNKSEQAATFESSPTFMALVASMTTQIDRSLIEQTVGEFYRYATFSHTWEGDEPLYQTVIKTVVYDLDPFHTHTKLQMFCKVARDEGLKWAWSDTCCINKADPTILQEALISMFKWYEWSALTIIFLCDVDELAEIGALMRSLWNSRAWTLQEYHASKVVRIYTKDWTPYLGLTIHNHKESLEIISEMEKATGISAQSLTALRPGLDSIREKLCLASTRQTTRVEDAAYSLLGIFSVTLPATYGEGDKALGRLLSQLLSSSGDTSILAWTGTSGSFNSCLPTNIIAFSQSLTSHIPPVLPDAEMKAITAGLRASQLDVNLVTTLYDKMNSLPLPSFSAQRMRLPCLVFKISTITALGNGVFRAWAGALGALEIKTRQNIGRMEPLYLVHPWIDFLLDRHATANIDLPPLDDEIIDLGESAFFGASSDPSSTLDPDPLAEMRLPPSPTAPLTNERMELLAQLRQPFGALLLVPIRPKAPVLKRIAAENVITAQIEGLTSATLSKLIDGARMLDVL